jgi:6-pyruvoyltetrahydropterin/6-carboxytetrahydropterin synthase
VLGRGTLRAMRARVTSTTTFEAAHQLSWHSGRCQRLHGHHYRLEVSVEGPLDEHGVVVDFDELVSLLEAVVRGSYDHRLLNELMDNPTAELLAARIWSELEGSSLFVGTNGPSGSRRAAGPRLARIRLFETPDSFVELDGDATD